MIAPNYKEGNNTYKLVPSGNCFTCAFAADSYTTCKHNKRPCSFKHPMQNFIKVKPVVIRHGNTTFNGYINERYT